MGASTFVRLSAGMPLFNPTIGMMTIVTKNGYRLSQTTWESHGGVFNTRTPTASFIGASSLPTCCLPWTDGPAAGFVDKHPPDLAEFGSFRGRRQYASAFERALMLR